MKRLRAIIAIAPIVSVVSVAASACADPDAGPPAAETAVPEATVRFLIGELGIPDTKACYAFTAEDSTGEVWLTKGTPEAKGTLSEAVAAGDRCEPGAGPVELVHACRPGTPHRVSVTLTGLFGVDGVALGGDRFGNPCPPGVGCALEFSCDPGRETRVELALSVIAPSHLGFFDIATYLPGRDRFAESCFYYRLARGRGSEGDVIFSVGPLCSSLYGGNDGGIGYITPCDAEAGDNTLTVWVERVIFREGLRDPGFVNPCPVPSDAATRSVDDWPGGCTITARCEVNADTGVDFELGAAPR